MATLPIHNPTLPFLGMIPNGIQPGLMLRIKGQMHPTGQRIGFYLQCGPALNPRDEVALHLSVRPNEQAIVRNHLAKPDSMAMYPTPAVWGTEERHGGCPIHNGQFYEILILAEASWFKIAVNGTHFAQFNYRIPLSRALFFSVDGDTTISFIGVEGDRPHASAPSATIPAPYMPIPSPMAPSIPAGGVPTPFTPHYQQPYQQMHTAPLAYMPSQPSPYGAGSGLNHSVHQTPTMHPYQSQPPNAYQPYAPGAYGGAMPNPIPYGQGGGSGLTSSTTALPMTSDYNTQMHQQFVMSQQHQQPKKGKALKYAAAGAAAGGIGLGAYMLSQAFDGDSD